MAAPPATEIMAFHRENIALPAGSNITVACTRERNRADVYFLSRTPEARYETGPVRTNILPAD